ncbi:MAG: hypothetical protein WDN47_00870 [Candidatus Doudnabacteria bacterium]
MKKIAILSLALLAFAFTASAAEFIQPPSKMQGSVSTMEQDVHKNLYIAGANVTVNSKTLDDLAAAGGMVTINGDVEKDLLLAGGNLTVNGAVGDNARIAGGNISISGPVLGDLVVAGGNITVAEKATVGGDLVVGGGNITVDSDIKGNVKIGGGAVMINSTITGNVDVMANKSLTFGPNSVVMGRIVYKGPSEAIIQDGAKVSTIDFTMIASRNVAGKIAALITIATLIKLLALFIAAWVLNRIFKGTFQTLSEHIYAKPWHSMGIGALVLFGVPLLAVILMITVLGLYLGLFLLVSYCLILLTSALLMPYFVGASVVAMYNKTSNLKLGWQELVYGLLIVTLVGWIPFIGWLAVLLVYLMTIGEVALHSLQKEHINI